MSLRARPLPLDKVRLLGGPLKVAQDLDARYLLQLEPDRMLAPYRERAGLQPNAAPYGGWDGGGRNLTGHIAGHYLSAVSLMWAATGDERFKERADRIVAGLKEVQDAHGDGYLCALEKGRAAFERLARGEIRGHAFDLNGEWSPWYTLHKTFAGLRDAYRYAGNRTALAVEIEFATWAERTLAGLDDAQVQRMLDTEFGGMNEVLVDLHADTGDRRWLDLSYRFEHRGFTEPLQRHQDNLAGKHGNTQVPKLLGSVDRFVCTGEPRDLIAASFFFDCVVQHHTFATGGHGKDEYFGPADRIGERLDGRTAETCNVYNMVKLARRLFALQPDAHYADFLERALFNHILASIDRDDGATSYMVPVGRGVQREWADMQHSFTCCVGTGMESHALHGDGIYYVDDDRLWVNLMVPSMAVWDAAGVRLQVNTDFPEGDTGEIVVSLPAPRAFLLMLRRPYWAADFAVAVNGDEVELPQPAPVRGDRRRGQMYTRADDVSSYVELRRIWQDGDRVTVTQRKTLRLESAAGDPQRAAVLWGPLVLAGDLGAEAHRGAQDDEDTPAPQAPVLVVPSMDPTTWLERVQDAPARFRTKGVGRTSDLEARAQDVELGPFYRLPRRRYAIYWDVLTPAEWQQRQLAEAAAAEAARRLEAATVARVRPGDAASEGDAAYAAGDGTTAQRILGRRGRRTTSFLSYRLAVDPERPMTLRLTFYSDDRRGTPSTFDVLVDGERIATQSVTRSDPPRFFDVDLAIPADHLRDKTKVTLRLQAQSGSQVATLFDVRMLDAASLR
ncbi:MAG: glycoside hydrolase family 127 protein [Planctomycetota bacterium]